MIKKIKEYHTKNKKEISSKLLQSAYDEDATYRKKAGKGESGYIINIAETCFNKNDTQLITDYKLEVNTKADSELVKERLPIIKEVTDCEEMTVDGAYYSEELVKNEEVKINFTVIIFYSYIYIKFIKSYFYSVY